MIPNSVQRYIFKYNLRSLYDFLLPFKVCIFALSYKIQWFDTLKDIDMASFGKKLRECREAKGLSQRELAKLLNTSYSVIGKYERDEMQPSIKAAQSIATLVDTTVGYLLGETDQTNILKDPTMLERLNEINKLPDEDRHCIMYTIDGLLQNVRTKLAFAK